LKQAQNFYPIQLQSHRTQLQNPHSVAHQIIGCSLSIPLPTKTSTLLTFQIRVFWAANVTPTQWWQRNRSNGSFLSVHPSSTNSHN